MRVLIGCEFSGVVRDAFLARGHDAYSCDLLPSEKPGPHLQMDVRRALLLRSWDLFIAHPHCTYLTNAGVHHLVRYGQRINPERWLAMQTGAAFFLELLNAEVPRVAVENPIMHKYGVEIIGRRQDQVIQPWMFGHPESKATCLWLRNLPPLVETNNVKALMLSLPRKERDRVHYASPGPDRWKVRARTLPGIADAMAEQWGSLEGPLDWALTA